MNSLPTSEPISIDNKETEIALINYRDAMITTDVYIRNRAAAVKGVYYQDTNRRDPQSGEGAWEYVRKLISAPFMGAINQMTEEIAGSNLNHMSQMKSFGDTLVVTGETFMATISATAAVAGAAEAGSASVPFLGAITGVLGGGMKGVIEFLTPMLTILMLGLFGFGLSLSIYAPMIPFITWVASVVNWFVLLIEAVLAAPIWAVAHIHPDGDDAVGRGGQGYMMILSLIMRPALMLFGLVTAMLLTQPVTGLVNAGFMSAVSGVQADSMTGIFSFLGYVTVYVILMTTVLHTVFSLIHWIPDNVPRWIGAHVSGGPASPVQKEREGNAVFGAVVRDGREAMRPRRRWPSGGRRPSGDVETPTPTEPTDGGNSRGG